MKRSMIWLCACVVATGISMMVPVSTAAADETSSCCYGSSLAPVPMQLQDATLYQQNPLGFGDATSPEGNPEEGTIGQSSGELDAEVGAGEHDVIETATTDSRYGPSSGSVALGVVILVAVAVVAMSVRLIFQPLDQIPRIGRPVASDDRRETQL